MDNTTIIVVDDSPFASKQIKDIVEENGYEVIGYAKNGEEGIKMYEELHPDIVILDIIMPGIDGIETAQILLKNDPDATILMLSSLCDSSTLEEVRSIGVKYLIPKPWEDDVLLATLELLKKQREQKKYSKWIVDERYSYRIYFFVTIAVKCGMWLMEKKYAV